MSDLIERLQRKAYQQGYNAGLRDLPWSPADWEAEFVPEYRRGRDDGRAARQTAPRPAGQSDSET